MKVRIECRGTRYSPRQRLLRWAAQFFFVAGCAALGYCAFVYFEARIYQASETLPFEKPVQPGVDATIPVQTGAPISRIEIPRLGVSAIVVEGVTARNLRLAVGHVPGTALPGESGNVGIAGHRDTFFRPLRYLHPDDRITLTTVRGSYEYSVESIRVVDPNDTQALRASSEPVLTLITCYPFYYVGPAPQRFIVRARQITRRW